MEIAVQYKPNVQIASDPDSVARQAVQLFISTALDAIRSHGRFLVAVSGGRTPRRFFEMLAVSPDAQSLPWGRIHVFWVDERYVASDSPDSNYTLAVDTFLRKVSIPPGNVHRIPTDYKDISDAARAYEQTIREVFDLRDGKTPEFDLIVLGMGVDGHIGSLFPDSYATFDVNNLVLAVYVPGDKHNRVTLTPSVLLAAKRLVILVTGREKAQTLKEVLTGEPDEATYPIHVLWPALNKIVWLVDLDAASLTVSPG
jgi:6-phosphogluconolactonase